MKNKKMIFISLIIILFICLVIITYITLLNKQSYGNFLQKYDQNNNKIEDIVIDNGLKLTDGKIEKNNGVFYVYMVATNNTKKDIDMTTYRISFIANSGEEIEYYSGEIIGVVKAGETFDFVVESYHDLSKTANIIYENIYK